MNRYLSKVPQTIRTCFNRHTAFCCALILLGGLWLRVGILYVEREQRHSVVADVMPSSLTVLIDPGHGGEDGGAQSADGTLEKNINLSISLPLRDLLRLFGFEVAMTRETDTAIYDPAYADKSGKKASDMRNRLSLYETAGCVISIHQNHFSQEKYSGAQMFYSPNHPASQTLAQEIRSAVLSYLQPENTRELKQANSNIFLLSKTTVPAVLVECGFISNISERERLKTSSYQRQMALSVAAGFLHYNA